MRYLVTLNTTARLSRVVEVEADDPTQAEGRALVDHAHKAADWTVHGSTPDRIGDLERVTIPDVGQLPSSVFTGGAWPITEGEG